MPSVLSRVQLIIITVENRKKIEGTGFHYGNGWVMTVAHNFQDDVKDKKDEHSVLSSGHFRVLFDVDGSKYEFEQHRRTAFVHHLQPGEYTDYENIDIAMVKLGIQNGFEGGSEHDWEKEERDRLLNMNLHAFAVNIIEPEPAVGDDVDAVHYGGLDNQKKHQQVKIKSITEAGKH